MTGTPAGAGTDPTLRASLGGRDRRPLFIVWTRYQRRVASMDQIAGFDVRYLPPPFAATWLKPLGYLGQALRTARAVLGRRPDEVWVQSPPSFLPHLMLALRPLAGGFRIVADCHHRALRPMWSRFPGTIWALNRCDVVLIHNEEARLEAEALGVDRSRTRVLEDAPPIFPAGAAAAGADAAPYALVPCSFGADEPIPTLLAAARRVPDLRILITGSRRKAEALGFVREAPPNVTFTDYLPIADFERLLLGAAVVVGLTTAEGVQLSVANEALGARKALVLSDTRILRAMFGDAAMFTRNAPEELAERLSEAIGRRDELETRSAELTARRRRDWQAAWATVAAKLA